MATKVLTKASAVVPLASRLDPALKPNQPTHSSEAPIIVMVSECGAIGSLPIADALAEHQRADEPGDTGIDVHDGAAGEVERADLIEPSGVCGDPVELGLRQFLGLVAAAAANPWRRSDGVGPGPVPDHVGDREIDERHPEQHEKHHGRELDALGEGADDQGRRDAGEGHLEGHVDEFGDDDPVREGRHIRVGATPFRKALEKPPT